jgi:hypothetical protein
MIKETKLINIPPNWTPKVGIKKRKITINFVKNNY